MRQTNGNGRLLNIKEAAELLGMGTTSARAWLDEAGATRKISTRIVRYDRTVIDKALDEMGAGQ